MKTYNEYKGTGIPKFPANSRVCFLGDSLTGGSLWVQMLFDFYLKNFPAENIRINDCGIGQGTARYGYETLEEDLLTFDPTHVVIMYGENDIKGKKGTSEERAESFYADMKRLADALVKRDITVYFMSESACPNDKRGEVDNRAVANTVMHRLAGEYAACFADLHGAYSPLITDKMLQDDGVHFTALGDAVLARVFLHLQGFDGFTPEDEGFFAPYEISYDLDRRMIFNGKIRRVWLAKRSITILGDTTEEKFAYLYNRLATRADGAWDDFCYYRAIDFIELYPHTKFYREELDRITDAMIASAVKSAK